GAGNGGGNRRTGWGNEAGSEGPGEAVELRDEETGMVWSPTPPPAGGDAPTIVRHGAGYTTYVQERNRLATELTVFVPCCDPVKVGKLRLANRGGAARRAAGGLCP